MQLNKRQQDLLQFVRRETTGGVEALAKLFGVTPQTIRRDIQQLEELGLVSRFHGGVGLPGGGGNIAYSARQVLLSAEKRRIAKLVASHIPDNAAIFINLGTTTEAVAHALGNHKGLRVITNNLNVATTMCEYPQSEVVVIGGVVRPRDHGVTGELAIDLIRQFNVDFAVIGVSSIGLDGTLREFDYREVRVTQAIMAQSRKVLLVADHTKIGRSALVKLGHLQDVDALYTDAPLPQELRSALTQEKPAVHLAP